MVSASVRSTSGSNFATIFPPNLKTLRALFEAKTIPLAISASVILGRLRSENQCCCGICGRGLRFVEKGPLVDLILRQRAFSSVDPAIVIVRRR